MLSKNIQKLSWWMSNAVKLYLIMSTENIYNLSINTQIDQELAHPRVIQLWLW